MLSEERVKHMTKMAIFEKKEGRKLQPVLKYRKRDYVELCMMIHVFLGTLVYGILYMAVLGLLFSTVFTNLHLFSVVLCLVLGLLFYVIYMYFYLKSIKKQYTKKYDEGVESAKELRKDYQILEQMYREEEQQKSPEGWY
ncbi:MAG: hypothetical protein PUB19_08500 [Lachnospiraceae bacterium]|nr:hypothetical protein [Lachnospiraceae bacterium]